MSEDREDVSDEGVSARVAAAGTNIGIFLWAAVAMFGLVVATAAVVVLMAPVASQTTYLAFITALAVPTIGILVTAATRENHLAMNSRLDELVREKEKTSRAEGVAAGRAGKNGD